MLTEQQILGKIRDTVDHPATVKELLQILKVAPDERPSFKRCLRGGQSGDPVLGLAELVLIARRGVAHRRRFAAGRGRPTPRSSHYESMPSTITATSTESSAWIPTSGVTLA